MSDGEDSSSFRPSDIDKGTSVLERLIQVRMGSGKIYGPYKRAEVIEFIRKGKIKGEEHILIEGEMSWKAISSDMEFFDELQAALLGVPSEKSKKKSRPKEKKTRTMPMGRQGSDATRTELLGNLNAPKSGGEIEGASPAHTPLRMDPADAGQAKKASPPPTTPVAPAPAKKAKIKKLPPWALGLAAVLVLGVAFFLSQEKNNTAQLTAADFSNVKSSKFYARHLVRELGRIQRLPELPKANLNVSKNLELPAGLGVHIWVGDMQKLLDEKNESKKLETSYWIRWAWDLIWTASAARSLDGNLARNMAGKATQIIDELKKQKVIGADTLTLLDAVFLFDEGKWKDVEALLAPNPLFEAQWLREEARWLASWSEGGAAFLPTTKDGGSEYWALTSQVRSGFFQSPALLFQSLEQLAELDPLSYHLWFSAAQFYWRPNSLGVERSMRYFLVGFAALGLYPRPIQEVVWEQFFRYLSAHGRRVLVERALQNREILRSGENFLSDNAKNWWDLGDEGLDIKSAIEQIYQKVKTSRAELVDLAALSVLGPVTAEGNAYMLEVAYRAAFDKNWDRALQMFSQIIQKDPKNTLALGGKIWAEANLYQFDDALNDLGKFGQMQAQNGEYDRYNGLILAVARDYDEAEKVWNAHVQKFPTDAWSYFFYARMKEGLEKNYDCTKAAGLARLHAEGELKARSDMLFYRCGVKAGIGVKEAFEQIDRLAKEAPNDISIQLEHIEALINSKRLVEALQVARDYVQKTPRSYDLRLKLGDVYRLRGDFDRAVAFYNNAVELRPRSAEAFIRIGNVLEDLKKLPEAAQNYETAAAAQPSYPDVFLMAARIYAKLKNVPKAAEMYVREINARPSSAATFLEAAEFFLANNAASEVPKLYKLYSEDFQQDPRVLTRLAQAYLGMGQYESARLNAANALVHDQKMSEPHRILGEAFEGMGNYQAAREQYETYLKLLPMAPEAAQIRSKISQPPFSQ